VVREAEWKERRDLYDRWLVLRWEEPIKLSPRRRSTLLWS